MRPPSLTRREIVKTRPEPYIAWIMPLNLTEYEKLALVALLTRTSDGGRYPLPPRVRSLKDVLARLRPEPVRDPLPPPKVYAPPRATAAKIRRS